MKKIAVVLMLALCVAGCHNNQKKVYTQSDVKEEPAVGQDLDWIGIYICCHELDSIKNVAETASAKAGKPMPALPDSISTLWTNMLNEILLRHGNTAFSMYESHRDDIEQYLRLDFINYGFITNVYLPFKATRSTREEYGVICIQELENEMEKAQRTLMFTGHEPSHYASLMKELFYAYLNYEKYDQASAMCEEILAYTALKQGEESPDYAAVLKDKADLCDKMGSSYSAMINAKRAVGIYEKLLGDTGIDSQTREQIAEDKKELEEKLQLWQGK